MQIKSLTAGRCAAVAVLLMAGVLMAQVAVAFAAGPELSAQPQVVAQAATATPFRFLTPTPFVPRTTTTTTTTSSTAPRAGGFPLELVLPALAGGAAALGSGTFLLRRKPTR
ncbi:MAG TPA: hypothetical protein VGQ62_03165 [Chloroflexota bacterium]|jgi:cytoskeletal protein RodZ|nr:hypothetical protein [Chloroflexota bacterium]